MEQKHTPGPWEIRRAASGNYFVYPENSKLPIAGIKYVAEGRDKDEQEANARLMAAAPDLLAACEASHNAKTQSELDRATDLIAQAIAKAKVQANA